MNMNWKRPLFLLVGWCVISIAMMQFSTTAYADCDMIGLLMKNGSTITDIDQLGSQIAGTFNEPSDFWTDWFKNFQNNYPRNANGYGILYYGLNGAEVRHVYEWPIIGGHNPVNYTNYPNNQVFRSDDQNDGNNTAFWWAQQRIWNLDLSDHNAFLILAHSRWASGGNNNIDDPHPFLWDYPWAPFYNPQGDNIDEVTTYTMEHNGSLNKADINGNEVLRKQKLQGMIQELWASWNPGQTWSSIYPFKTAYQGNNEIVDSEIYFHWIVENIKLAGNEEEGLRRALIAMKNWDCYKNIVFSDALHMYAYRGYGGLQADGMHKLLYFDFDDPGFYAVSTAKYRQDCYPYTEYNDPILYAGGTAINNHQMVKMRITNTLTTYDNFDQPQHHRLPYSCDFEDSRYSTVDSSWYLNCWEDDNDYGRIRVAGDDVNRYLLMDTNTNGQRPRNEANIYMKLAGQNRVRLKFSWIHYNEEYDNSEGVYFSDNGGLTFTRVYPLNTSTNPSNTWKDEALDVDSLCSAHGLIMNDQFVIQFVQEDNYQATTDGIGIDNISVYTAYTAPGYSMDFETGEFDEYWQPCPLDNGNRVRITDLYNPYEGSYHMVLDSGINNHYVASYADLHVNFSLGYCTGYRLKFQAKEFNDETNTQDAIYFSDDGGQTFTRVHPLDYLTNDWQEIDLSIGSLASAAGLTLNDRFVIRFQQYDNYGVTSDGMAFDAIRIYSTGPCYKAR